MTRFSFSKPGNEEPTKEVPLAFKNEAIEKPTPIPGHFAVWNGKAWEYRKIHTVIRRVKKILNPGMFRRDVELSFPGIEIQIIGDMTMEDEHDLIFKGLPATQENQDKLDAVIRAHKAQNTNMDNMDKLILACFKLMVQEINKIDARFPCFADFKNKVKQMMGE